MSGSVLRHGVVIAAVSDWLIAATMVVTATRREVAVPLLVTAAGTVLALNRAVLAELARAAWSARAAHTDAWSAVEEALTRRVGARAARAVLREPRLLWSVVLLARRRYDGQPAPCWPGHRDALPTWLLLLGLGVVELAVTPLLPLPRAVEVLLIAVGVWAMVVTAGLIAALVVHPHLLTAAQLRVRTGFWAELRVPREAIANVTLELRTVPRGLSVHEGQASLSATSVANVTIRLQAPTDVGLPEPVHTLRVWADHPTQLRRALSG